MPRESRFRRSAVNPPARRRLFSDQINHDELSQRLQSQLDAEVNAQSRRWGFDFQNGIPLNCGRSDNATASSSTTSSETFIYESLNANEVPVLYRSHMILRQEIPRVGVVEIKHYPTGRGPIETPTKAVNPPPPKLAENSRKRHLPSPSTTPMKLRKRVSPHKTPVNPGPNHIEHTATSNASKRPRRNLAEKFEDSAVSAVLRPSTSTKKDSCK